ncbi:MAG: phage recombination protein Bet, partial [Nitratireductor sp.]|nr:phage recombination protein Bet [Nitratireductor sp.]
MNVPAPVRINSSGLDILRRGHCRKLNNQEFDEFVRACENYGLDPFRKQIIPIVFNEGNQQKRKMEFIITRDGYRVIASRCGNYRPKSKPAAFTYDDALRNDHNPAGIVSVMVELYWQDNNSQWHPVAGEAYWEEFAPLENEWGDDPQSGRRKVVGKKLSANWAKMPRVMLEKCAESGALRAGWPEQFAGLYGEEEMAKVIAEDVAASELAELGRTQRLEKTMQFKNKVAFNFGEGVQYVECGKAHDAWMENVFHKHRENPQIILTMRDQSREALRYLSVQDKNAALDLKAQFERVEAR